MKPKISVIVPVYNVEQYLYRCLTSIISQSLYEIEIICINDGSTDNSLSILYEFAKKDKRIQIINQENAGASAARNNGLKNAKGEFVGFVDADDTIEKDFYKLLYENAIKHQAEIACGGIKRPDSARRKDKNTLSYYITRVTTNTTQKYKLCKIPQKNFIWNKIYNRIALLSTNIEFPVGVVYEDILWSHMVLDKLGKLVTVPKATYNYMWNNRAGGANFAVRRGCDKGYRDGFIEALSKSIEYTFANNIRIPNYKFYKPLKRIRINIAGIRFFDLRIWNSVKVFYILGIEVCRIFVNNSHINN